MSAMTRKEERPCKAKSFMRANDQSPVVYGAATGRGGKGGTYRLEDGKRFVLSLADVLALDDGYPKWIGQ